MDPSTQQEYRPTLTITQMPDFSWCQMKRTSALRVCLSETFRSNPSTSATTPHSYLHLLGIKKKKKKTISNILHLYIPLILYLCCFRYVECCFFNLGKLISTNLCIPFSCILSWAALWQSCISHLLAQSHFLPLTF